MDWSQALPDEIDLGFDHFSGLQAAAQAELCRLIQAADTNQTWMSDGARNLTEWVALRLSARPETARYLVSVARRLLHLPVVTDRFAKGDLSLDQVDAITRMATPDTEAGLVEEALGLSNAALDRVARRSSPPRSRDERMAWQRRALWLQWNLDESELRLGARLPAAEGEIVQGALESRADRFGPNPDTGVFDPYPARLADALVELAATTGATPSAAPPQVSVHADLDSLTTTDDGVAELVHGGLVPNETARRLCCDAVVEAVVYRDDVVVGVGRNGRTVPGWLRRLVHHRDGGRCRFPGCNSTRWLQVHHIQHWPMVALPTWTISSCCAASTTGSSTSTIGTSPVHPGTGPSVGPTGRLTQSRGKNSRLEWPRWSAEVPRGGNPFPDRPDTSPQQSDQEPTQTMTQASCWRAPWSGRRGMVSPGMEKSSHHTATWVSAPESHFTGEVTMAPLADPGEGVKATAVRFEPGARTDWHSHPSGQVLHVVAGRGRLATAGGARVDLRVGDTITTPPGEVHWHGAAPDEPMIHLSIVAAETEWAEAVPEDEYRD